MGMFPIRESLALAKMTTWEAKTSNDLGGQLSDTPTSNILRCNKWLGNDVPARGSCLSQAAMKNVQIWTLIRGSPKQENCAASSSTRELKERSCAQM